MLGKHLVLGDFLESSAATSWRSWDKEQAAEALKLAYGYMKSAGLVDIDEGTAGRGTPPKELMIGTLKRNFRC
jgi:hypothetical protein